MRTSYSGSRAGSAVDSSSTRSSRARRVRASAVGLGSRRRRPLGRRPRSPAPRSSAHSGSSQCAVAMHAGAVALSAGVERVLVPALSSTFSALGCCLSELAIDDVRTCLARLDEVDWPRVERELEGLVDEIAATLKNGLGALRVARSLELRYRDQNDELDETAFGPVLRRGAVELVEGPAVLADALSTVVVWPGQTARTDEDGNVWLERA